LLIKGVIASDATITSADGVGAKTESLMPSRDFNKWCCKALLNEGQVHTQIARKLSTSRDSDYWIRAE